MELFIGTSGFSYPHWGNGVFYPTGIPQNQWLEFYSRQFNTVEINATFYKTPDLPMIEGWQGHTPKEFRFVIKGTRFITHIKRLKDVEDPLKTLAQSITPLQSKIHAFLWQLPPHLPEDAAALSDFCRLLDKTKILKKIHHVFEFRHEGWFCHKVYDVLKNFNYCLCFADAPVKIGEEVATSDFMYVRFHGGKAFYNSNYSRAELEVWADKVKAIKGRLKRVYAFFNNDEQGFAVYNAQLFRMMLLERNI